MGGRFKFIKKTNKIIEEIENAPIIQINWGKSWRYIKKLGTITKRIIEEIIKTILWILIFIIQGIIASYLAFKKFCKKQFKGFWILFILIISIVSFLLFYKNYYLKQKTEIKDWDNLYQEQLQKREDVIKEKEEEIEELEKKLSLRIETTGTAYKLAPQEVKELIAIYAKKYGVSAELSECIVMEESGGDPTAIGDHGKAVGVCQYHLATFKSHRTQMGRTSDDLRTDPKASIEALSWALSKGYGNAWTTYQFCI